MPLQFGVVLTATVLIAVPSWELFERPIVRWSTGAPSFGGAICRALKRRGQRRT